MSALRIGLITGEYPPMAGGIADYTAILARELRAAGQAVYILTRQEAAAGPEVRATVTNWNRAAWRDVRAWADDLALDVINLQYQTAAYDMAGLVHFLPSRVGRPCVTTFHDLRFPYLFPKAGPLRPWIVRQLARRSAAAIVTNPADEAQLRADVPGLWVARVPLGATVAPPEGTPQPDRAALGLAADEFVVGHFGFVNHSKGVETLLEAVAELRARGVPARVLMIGERVGASDPTNAAYGAHIDALADRLGLAPVWTGFVDDPGDYFATLDALALPFTDGASLRRTSLQAGLVYGCAVVTTRPPEGPPPELAEAVRYVPPGDAAALAEALHTLYEQPAQRAQLGHAARDAAQQFAWPEIAARILAVYRGVSLRKPAE